MPELIGEENIDWENFEVTDPEAPEFAAPEGDPDVPEPVAGNDEDVLDAPEDTADDGRPRDPETGQFVAAEEAEQERLYANKYRTVEEMEAAVLHQESFAGRQAAELGELRQELAGRLDSIDERLDRPAPPSLHNLDQVFEENPFLAAEQTLQAQDWAAHDRVIKAWEELDPSQVGLYKATKTAERRAYEADQKLEAFQQSQQQAPAYQSALESAQTRLQTEHPEIDLGVLQQAMIDEAMDAARISGENVYSSMMKSGDPNKVYMGLRTLALAAERRVTGDQRQRATDLARTSAVETQRAKAEAMVTSATGSAPDPAPPRSYDDELLAEFEQDDKRRDGFNIGDH